MHTAAPESVVGGGPMAALPHLDLLTFLMIAQKLDVDLLPITWHSTRKAIGSGATSHVNQSSLNVQLGFAFKRFQVEHNSQRDESEVFKRLIAEILVLQHQAIRDHPNIIDLYGVSFEVEVDTSGALLRVLPVLVFEKSELGTLADFLSSREGCLAAETRLQLCRDVGNAIATMHSCNIIHSDIKPENILIFPDAKEGFVARIIDFGYSCLGCKEEDVVRLARTEGWEAPEWHARGFTIKDAKKTDVYSYGRLCSFILFGDQLSDTLPGSLKAALEDLQSVEHLRNIDHSRLEEFFRISLEVEPWLRTGDIGYLTQLFSQALRSDQKETRNAIFNTTRYAEFHGVPDLCHDLESLTDVNYLVRVHILEELKRKADGDCATCREGAALQLAFCYEYAFATERDVVAAAEWRNRYWQMAGFTSTLSQTRPKPYTRTYKGRLKTTGEAIFFDVDLADEYARSGVSNDAVSTYFKELSGRFSAERYMTLTQRLRDVIRGTGNVDEIENLETRLKAWTMTQAVDQLQLAELIELNADITFRLERGDSHETNEVVKLQQQLLETSEKHLGEEDPFTISVINRFAQSLRVSDPPLALKLRERALRLTTKSRGAEHSESMRTAAEYAESLADICSIEEALATATQVLEARLRTSGEAHPETTRVMANLGDYLCSLGRLDEAASFQRRVLEARMKRLPSDHPMVLMARLTLDKTMQRIEENRPKARA